jgi:hypothetical protein
MEVRVGGDYMRKNLVSIERNVDSGSLLILAGK